MKRLVKLAQRSLSECGSGNREQSIPVLVVDHESVSSAVKECLEMQGPFVVEVKSSIMEVSEKMKKGAFGVIVSDYVMLGDNDLELLKKLRQERMDVPLVLFTGLSMEEAAERTANLRADKYVSKAGDPESVFCQLARGIIQAVDERRHVLPHR